MSSTLFMTPDELAREAECTSERVEELARMGVIPGIKWGRSWKFVRADAPQFLAEIARQEAAERRSKKSSPVPVKPSRRRGAPVLPVVRSVS